METLTQAENLGSSTQVATPRKRGGGPKTREGKDQSRRNALQRGLRSKIVFPEEMAAVISSRTRTLLDEFAPKTSYETVLVCEMAVASVKMERCASLGVADLVRAADRARQWWDDDRRVAAETLAAGLSKAPGRTVWTLRQTRQGAQHLIERWALLSDIARDSGRWDEGQRSLAFDLLGVPIVLRNGTTEVPDGDDGPAVHELAESQIEILENMLDDGLDDFDAAEQEMAVSGLSIFEDNATKQLRKDEIRARNDFYRAHGDLLKYRDGKPCYPSRHVSLDDAHPLIKAAVAEHANRGNPTKPVEAPAAIALDPAPEVEPEVEPEPAEKAEFARSNRKAPKQLMQQIQERNRQNART